MVHYLQKYSVHFIQSLVHVLLLGVEVCAASIGHLSRNIVKTVIILVSTGSREDNKHCTCNPHAGVPSC